MRLQVNNPKLTGQVSLIYSTLIRVLLYGLLGIATVALFVGVIKSGIDLFQGLSRPLEDILQSMLLDVVFIVALVEISLTILGYLRDGRVHVRYIVDTVLIIILNEVVRIWFSHPDLSEAIGISVTIVALAAVRLAVTRFAPKDDH